MEVKHLFVDAPGSTSSSLTPSTAAMASAMASMTFLVLPSEKFGTHSTILAIFDDKAMQSRATDCTEAFLSTSYDETNVSYRIDR